MIPMTTNEIQEILMLLNFYMKELLWRSNGGFEQIMIKKFFLMEYSDLFSFISLLFSGPHACLFSDIDKLIFTKLL